MNYSIYSADRATHLKVVVVALVTGIAIACCYGLSSRANFRANFDAEITQNARGSKADQPLAMSSSHAFVIR